MSDEPKLTGKQRMFCEHYIACCFNATEAARRAGYSDNGDTALSVRGHELLRNSKVSDYIAQRTAETVMSANEVLLRLGRMAQGSLEPFIDTGEQLKGDTPHFDLSTPRAIENLHLIKKMKTKSITKIKEGDDESGGEGLNIVEIELEIHDPKDALVQLGRYHKLFTDKQEVTGKDGGPIELTDTERAKRLDFLLSAARARRDGATTESGSGDAEK